MRADESSAFALKFSVAATSKRVGFYVSSNNDSSLWVVSSAGRAADF